MREYDYTLRAAYWHALTAGYQRRPWPQHNSQLDQQAADRGYWDGCKLYEQEITRVDNTTQ